jgi:hypothetical protein
MNKEQRDINERKRTSRDRRNFRRWWKARDARVEEMRPKTKPELEKFSEVLVNQIEQRRRRLTGGFLEEKIEAVLLEHEFLSAYSAEILARQLRRSGQDIRDTFNQWADRIEARRVVNITPPARRRLSAACLTK